MITRHTYDDRTNELLDDLAWFFDCNTRDIIVGHCIFATHMITKYPFLIDDFKNAIEAAKEAYKRGYRTEGEDDNE